MIKRLALSTAIAVGIMYPTQAFAVGTYNGHPIPDAPVGGVVFCEDGFCSVVDSTTAARFVKPATPHKRKLVHRRRWF